MEWPSESVLHFVFHLQPRSPELYWSVHHQHPQQNWAPAPFLGQCRWKPPGLLGMPSPFNWGGDPSKIDATKARLAIWKSQAVPRKRPLSRWNVDIKTNASPFNRYLSLAASFQGQPHFVLFTFCYLPLCFTWTSLSLLHTHQTALWQKHHWKKTRRHFPPLSSLSVLLKGVSSSPFLSRVGSLSRCSCWSLLDADLLPSPHLSNFTYF